MRKIGSERSGILGLESDGSVTPNEEERASALAKGKCSGCGEVQLRSERYDACYCPACNRWLESKCSDANCHFCRARPEKPLDAALKTDVREESG